MTPNNNEKATVVDLAAGTGLFTEALVASSGRRGGERFEIIAVEPHDQMRQELESKALPGVRVVKGWASELPIESASVDVVFATQVSQIYMDAYERNSAMVGC